MTRSHDSTATAPRDTVGDGSRSRRPEQRPGQATAPALPPLGEARPLRVAWHGAVPEWLEGEAREELGGIELQPLGRRVDRGSPAPDAVPDIVHVPATALGELRGLRRKLPGARFVLDLTGARTAELGWRFAAQAAGADLVLAGSLFELRELRRRSPALAARSALFREPVDTGRYGPDAELFQSDHREHRRFRRYHRLVGQAVLFAGPYTPAGGLDLAVAAMQRVRSERPEARLLAVPLGPVDSDYLDRCEREALGFGHHGVIEWATPSAQELPLWLACADAVCLPSRDAVPARAAWLAGASAKPVIASDVPQLLEHVGDGTTGLIVPAGDPAALATALGRLLASPDEAQRLGQAARRRSEQERSPAAAARELRQLWAGAVTERRPRAATAAATGTTSWPALGDETPSPSTSP